MIIKHTSNALSKKFLRVTFFRSVEQQASTDILLLEDDYNKLKNSEIKPEEVVKKIFGENMDLDYTSVGWIETGAEKPKMKFNLGTWDIVDTNFEN